MAFGDLIAASAIAEMARFGAVKETQEPLKSRIGEYYRAVGANFDGGDTAIAWSAAFVSKMVEVSGGGDHFPYNILHAEYIYRLIRNQRLGIGVFRGWNAHGVRLRLGDIVASNRRDKPPISFAWAEAKSSYFSHCDIVTQIPDDSHVVAIGGNVGDRIARTNFHRIGGEWRNTGNANHRIFCLIRAIGWPSEDQAAPNFVTMKLPGE